MRRLQFEVCEPKLCLASVGWDGIGQGSAELTYYLGPIPESLDADVIRGGVETAFQAWADVVDIEFTPTGIPNLRDSIDIEFTEIDGPNGTLARAYFPDDVVRSRIAGDVEFDIAENWEVGNRQGNAAFDFVWVLVHELGHSLGLEHLEDRDAVLFASVSPAVTFQGLSAADVDAILELYAPAVVVELPGDLNADGVADSLDVDLITEEIRAERFSQELDLNSDGQLDEQDRQVLLDDLLEVPLGDVNLDGVFDSSDLVLVFQAGLYDDDEVTASWVSGDWNGDGRFDSSDIVFAFQQGRYVG